MQCNSTGMWNLPLIFKSLYTFSRLSGQFAIEFVNVFCMIWPPEFKELASDDGPKKTRTKFLQNFSFLSWLLSFLFCGLFDFVMFLAVLQRILSRSHLFVFVFLVSFNLFPFTNKNIGQNFRTRLKQKKTQRENSVNNTVLNFNFRLKTEFVINYASQSKSVELSKIGFRSTGCPKYNWQIQRSKHAAVALTFVGGA